MPAHSSTLEAYTRDALHLLQRSVQLAAGGETAFYRVAAMQLRLLLCDTTRRHGRSEPTALAPRLLPELKLPPVLPNGKPDRTRAPLPLNNWLDQPLPDGDPSAISLRTLIRRVCDQDGGAHVDPRPHAGLADIPDPAGWILNIGAAAAEALEAELQAQAQANNTKSPDLD